MPYVRKVTACDRCRRLKRRCDRVRPTCSKCRQAGVPCSFSETGTSSRSSGRSSSSPSSPTTAFDLTSLESWAETALQTPIIDPSTNEVAACKLVSTTNQGKSREIRRRNRVRFSCTRCHRMKVKCDKKSPCTRCRNSGFASGCSYMHKSNGEDGSVEGEVASPEPESFSAIFQAYNTRHRGSSHWRVLMHRVKELTSWDFNLFVESLRPDHAVCTFELTVPINYPFGSQEAIKFHSLKAVMELLSKTSSSAETYVDNYFRIFEALHPVFDVDSPGHDVVPFDASTPPSSIGELVQLAQYLVVLGLGCSATLGTQSHSANYYLAAEACLMKTPFMFRPTLATVRTLCLMVMAKRVANATCWAIDASWSLAGLMLRLAVMLGLHHEPTELPESETMTWADWHARRKLWTTIVYLDVEIAMVTGMPALLRRDEVHSAISSLSYSYGQDGPVTHFHDPLYDALPIIMEIATQVNATTDQLTYEQAVQYNATVRQLMIPALNAATGFRQTTLDIFFRRVLLVLHRKFAHHASSPFDYPISYWSSLECSLALLVHQRGMWEGNDGGLAEVSRVFMLDFISAAMTTCIHVLREDAPLSALAVEAADGAIPPRQTILETLRACVEIWGRQQDKSPCIKTGFLVFGVIVEEIPEISSP
ncbi:hypothetical protein jhhlp_002933 [Lomentospora prolificans]|uniref:Zn(2)-C6 fungal-type domain-containing protein n=1 Tax=Lomentospora prolificans TaxID=41688 RepID=A0A2N3NFM3_9PEZI|nr:hypothetical protein jhhlp_002933 [Lomentospora prolificans]